MWEDEEMRVVYSRTLQEMARRDGRIVVLDADLMKPNGTVPFAKEFPARTFDVGVAEANMTGVASGLSNEGFIPFAATFTVFASRRAFDQFFQSCAYAGLNVKLVGTDPGITAELNGGTHMGLEDVGIMRLVPGITIIEPPDNTALRRLLPQVAEGYGPAYVRLVRKKTHVIYDGSDAITLGKANTIREGDDAAIICSGIMVHPSLCAAENLAKKGVRARVVNMHTIKPLDVAAIVAAARETGAIVSAENHNVLNGLGSAVADVLSEQCPAALRKIGVCDQFGEVGTLDYLMQRYRMTPADIEEAVFSAMTMRDNGAKVLT